MMVLLTRPVRWASSARLSAPSPWRNAVSTAKARSADGTPLTAQRGPGFFGTRHRPTTPAMGLPGPSRRAIPGTRNCPEQPRSFFAHAVAAREPVGAHQEGWRQGYLGRGARGSHYLRILQTATAFHSETGFPQCGYAQGLCVVVSACTL